MRHAIPYNKLDIHDHTAHNFRPGYAMVMHGDEHLIGVHTPQYIKRELKYCELCTKQFCRSYEEKEVLVNEKLTLQRIGDKHCPTCKSRFLVFEQGAANDLKTLQQAKKLQEQYLQEKRKFRRRGAPEEQRIEVHGNKSARTHYATWRIPLIKLFQSKESLTSAEIGKVMGCKRGAEGVARARQAGMQIVVIGHIPSEHKGREKALYGLNLVDKLVAQA